MTIQSKLSITLLCAASTIALASAAQAQETAATETVVVTGSRVISDAANSPTPLTVVSTAQLLATTPSDVPDALNKLPIFSGSTSPTTSNTAGSNSSGNVLNLRNFGAQRTLILLDGHRATPSNANGTVDIDSLPQMLVTRVDVVTGGASAVYGSDAVTGVVNFVLDKHFTGLKVNANAGISNYTDGASYQLGGAAGTDLFGGRGHVEVAARHYHVDQILVNARPYGSPTNWVITGAGTAASPYVNTINGTLNAFSFGGKITCTGTTANPCTANNTQFVSNGVIGPFYNGIATGTGNVFSGGDGTYPTRVALSAGLRTDELFGRFSYNLDDTTTAYVQLSGAEANDFNNWTNNYIQNGSSPNTFYKNNAYLTPLAQAQLAGGTTSTFNLAEYYRQPGMGFITRALNTTLDATVGLDGTLFGKYDWDVFYTHGENRLREDDPTNQSNAKMYAAEDAVVGANGQIVCQVSTTIYANLYPGCVPMNPFGPTALTTNQYNYQLVHTGFIESNILDDTGASISGSIFDLPAGPVKAALSGEMRWLSYGVNSFAPQGFVDCTGLRLCVSGISNYAGSTFAGLSPVSNNVWEFAAETDVPLLKDLPFVQSLSANLAGRYTDYSSSGAVQTWKIGLDYHVNDTVRFRATNSVDIRAPTLDDLFSPQQIGHGGFSDIHTGNTVQNALNVSQGNANLVPEVARTYTAGVVLTPSFIPGFTASVDYYQITLKNAIGSIGGGTTGVQQVCEASGGASPLCNLFVRPLAFSNTTPANYPIEVLTEKLNTALNQTEGWDIEMDYGFQMADVWDALPGALNLRLLTNIQPYNDTQQYVGAPFTVAAIAKGRVTGFVAYNIGSWTINLQNRWFSGYPRSNQPGLVFFQEPRAKAQDLTDINFDKKFEVDGNTLDGYFSIQNLLNRKPPVAPLNATVPGLYANGYQASGGTRVDGVDNIGRYFTIGIRASL